MNEHSSRSHAIFILTVECCKVCVCVCIYCSHGNLSQQLGVDGQDHIRVGKLNLVDLAGSERQSKTGTTVRSCDLINGYTAMVTILGRTFQGGH